MAVTMKVRQRLLRSDLDVAGIRSRLERRGIVEVRDVLAPAWANRMHQFLARAMPKNWWSVAIRAGGDPEYFPDTPASREQIREAYSRARGQLRDGQFT